MRCVYRILNTVNGMMYVGSTSDLAARWRKHRWLLSTGQSPCKPLQAAWQRYGEDAFEVDVLEAVPRKTRLKSVEQKWLDRLQSYDRDIGYNVWRTARGPAAGQWTPEAKARLSASLTGKVFTKARCRAISRGRKASPKARAAIADLNRGKRVLPSKDVRAIVAAIHAGLSQEKTAAQFGVSRQVVRSIIAGLTYRDVTKL